MFKMHIVGEIVPSITIFYRPANENWEQGNVFTGRNEVVAKVML